MKYNKKILWDFINNKKIPQHITDYNFYIDAINITNDKELYYKCPKEVQNNYTFALFLIDKFKDDTIFIDEVAQNYLDNTPKGDYTYQELIFIMSDLMNFGDKNCMLYKTTKDIIYASKRALINEYIYEDGSEEYGLGFLLVLLNENSKVITNYFATIFIEEIFYDIAKNELEEIIHMTYKDRFDFVTYGIDNFIIEFTSLFDGYLAYYIKNDPSLIKDVHKYIKKIAKNWNKYVKENYSDKLDELEKAIQAIIEKHKSSLSIEEIYNYIDKKSILFPVKISNDDIENNKLLSNKKINVEDYRCLKESLDTTEDIFNCKGEKNQDDKKYKSKILEFKQRNKE